MESEYHVKKFYTGPRIIENVCVKIQLTAKLVIGIKSHLILINLLNIPVWLYRSTNCMFKNSLLMI